MLTPDELSEYFNRLGLPAAGRALIETARREAPVRKARSNGSNVVTRYTQSKKMAGRALVCESLHVELPVVVLCEHDPECLEYLTQPCRLDLILNSDSGKRSRVAHVPDVLRLLARGPVLEEWKEEHKLIERTRKYPKRFFKDDTGRWRFPEAEEQMAELGITYRLRSADEFPQQYIQNITFLSDYLLHGTPLSAEKVALLRSTFDGRRSARIAELLAKNGITADDLHQCIADGAVAFDLMNDDLSQTHTAQVFIDSTALALEAQITRIGGAATRKLGVASLVQGCTIIYEGKRLRVALVGTKNVVLTGEEGPTEVPVDVLAHAFENDRIGIEESSDEERSSPLEEVSEAETERVLSMLKIMQRAETGDTTLSVSKRTLQRWKKSLRDAGPDVGKQLTALSRRSRRGNRTPKLPQKVFDAIATVATHKYNKATNITIEKAYKDFSEECAKQQVRPCSRKSFGRHLRELVSPGARRGKRLKYQEAPIVWYLERDFPIHGVRPFELVHIDHTPLELTTKAPHSPKRLGTVWLSMATDAESREVIGYVVSYRPPSYYSVMMLLRDIVRRHHRLPSTLVLDNGAEFHSRALEHLADKYAFNLRWRPAGQPRVGTVCERMFGTTHTQFIRNLQGNNQILRYARTVTKSVNPNNFTEWTLPALHGGLEYYFSVLYGKEPHPAHGEGPVAHRLKRMDETGLRLNRMLRYDRTFLIDTCPPVDRTGTRVVDNQRGVKVDWLWYWGDSLASHEVHGAKVPVRLDPWDPRYVFVLVNKTWVSCRCKLVGALRNYTQAELQHAMDTLERTEGVQKAKLTPVRLAEWLHAYEATNFDERLRLEGSEERLVYEALGMTAVEPEDDAPPSRKLPSAPPPELPSPPLRASPSPSRPAAKHDIADVCHPTDSEDEFYDTF